jgi:hypothetical protein
MRRFVLVLIALLIAAAPASAARRPDRLRVTGVEWHPDRREFRLTLRCDGTVRACAGRLSFQDIDGNVMAVERRVRLRPRHPRRLRRRAVRDAPRLLAQQTVDKGGIAYLGALQGDFLVAARPTCTTGRTVAADAATRVFRLYGYGLFFCRKGGRAAAPVQFADEDDSISPDSTEQVHLAGHYIAFVSTVSWKCYDSRINLYDMVRRRRVYWTGPGGGSESDANGCLNSAPVTRLVLTPAGSFAWIDGPETDGQYVVDTYINGHVTQVDHSASIAPASLALSRPSGSVTWLRDGALQTAPLP